MARKLYNLYWAMAACLLLASCRSEGDKHPELSTFYEAIEAHPDFELQPLFNDQSLVGVKVIGPYLFASHFSTPPSNSDTGAATTLSVEVWQDGDSVRSFAIPSQWGNYEMAQDADSNIYQGKYRILAPDYKKMEILPVISADSMKASLKRLQTILAGTQMTVTADDLQGVFGKDYKPEHTDSLTGLLFGNFTNDQTALDSSYRRHLYFFFRNCSWYIKHREYAIIHYGQQSYFWELGKERQSVAAMLTQFKNSGGKEHGRRTEPYSHDSGDGPVGYGSSLSHVSITKYDESLAEWKVEAIGAAHVGGIIFPNPEYIWYYHLSVDGVEKLRFKIYENTSEEDIAFLNYHTSKRQFYIIYPSSNSLERVTYTGTLP